MTDAPVLEKRQHIPTMEPERKVFICAVTFTQVRLIGPFPYGHTAGDWGRAHLENPCWNTVNLTTEDVADPLELFDPAMPYEEAE